jgi:serine/threonine protein kinase
MNCAVDYRTDLYSLGIAFYEMLTGDVPFRSNDAMEIIHSHIAKEPVPPRQMNPAIPEPLSDIVMKLLSKEASERYQNGLGLAADLRTCLEQIRTRGRVEPFDLGALDISLRFIIPQNVVGRDKELGQLSQAFDRIVLGPVEVIMVAGEPGIGKSALIQEIFQPFGSAPVSATGLNWKP